MIQCRLSNSVVSSSLSVFMTSKPNFLLGTLFLSRTIVGPFRCTSHEVDTFTGTSAFVGNCSFPSTWPLSSIASTTARHSSPAFVLEEPISITITKGRDSSSKSKPGLLLFLILWHLFLRWLIIFALAGCLCH